MTIISSTATKPSKDSKCGIVFERAKPNFPLVIKEIREGGLLEASEVKPGMVVESINGEPMTWKSPKDAAEMLKQAESEISIACVVAKATVTKAAKEDKVGISIKNSTTKKGMWISKIAEETKFADSELKVGMQVLFINDTACPSDTKEAIQLVKDAEGDLTIVAVDVSAKQVEEETHAAPAEQQEEKKEAPVEQLEEKKEETPSEVQAPVEEETMTEEEKEKKGLLDTVFSACIC